MSKRTEAVWRIVIGLPFLVALYAAGAVLAVAQLVVYAGDVSWQLVTGREGLQPGNRLERWWDLIQRNQQWVVWGDGDGFEVRP